MGRTKRRRSKKKKTIQIANLDGESTTISLCKWMKGNGWKNDTNLHLRDFQFTGRGVFSKTSFSKNDLLIQIPYNLLITYSTIQKSKLHTFIKLDNRNKLKFQDLLVLFLLLEKHKGLHSHWHPYIASLPQEAPSLPLMCPQEGSVDLPEDLQEKIKTSRWRFEESWERLKNSIAPCCSSCVSDLNSFTWAFAMVNTRAVYVDPAIIHDLSEGDLRRFLSDEPCMALCPFLDMFNHDCDAGTRAGLRRVAGGWVYELRTLKGCRKHEQVFISYGAHDNVKLLCEYGFFVRGNKFDCVRFKLEEVLGVLEMGMDRKQKRFICGHGLGEELYVGFDGMSFNLKGVFCVMLYQGDCDWSSCVFSESYSLDVLRQMRFFARRLLRSKVDGTRESLIRVSCKPSTNLALVIDYLKYRVELLSALCEVVSE